MGIRQREGYLFPLSLAQARLWILDQLAPGSVMYNLRGGVRIRQALDPAAMQRALNAVVERHEALRTVFRVVDGGPAQLVLPAMSVPLQCYDLRRLPRDRRDEAAARLAVELADEPFALSEGPLLRALLIWLGPADYAMVFCFHHIVADGWSMGVLARELGALYEAEAAGREARLAPLPVQYADFAVWQREWLSGERLAQQVAYWREALAGMATLELPLDRPRPAVQAHRGAGFAFAVPAAVVEGLGRVARQAGATLFMTLLAGFGAVLGRWCGQEDVVVGAPIAGRNRAELEGLIGFFVNTLVLRVDLSGEPSFRELVGRVRQVALGAYAHADLPFEKLVEELAPQRDLSRNPLFQVTFQLFDAPTTPEGAGPRGGFELPVTSSLFDLRVDLSPGPAGGLSGRVEFDTDLLDRESVEWLVERFEWFLAQVAADPERAVGAVWLLPPAHRRRLAAWNATAAPAPRGCVHPVVAERAARDPGREAVADAGGAWSYGELEGRANRLAHRLVDLGVAVGDVVAVCLPRGRAFVAAALGVLRAGAAYLPLDPAYPPARLAHVLHDAAPAALIADPDMAGDLPRPDGVPLLGLAAWPAGPEEPPEVAVQGADAAYVIYTSGSTGAPKGVVVEHRSLLNLVAWHQRAYAVGAADRGAQVASVGFDAAVWEIWPYLCAGASVCVCDDDTRAEPERLVRWLADNRISVAFLPTPLAELVIERPWPAQAALRVLLTGGDTLRRWANPAHPYALVNHYGPTESTVVTSAAPVPAQARDGRLPAIGGPIANTVCYVVDRHGTPVGPGCPGELWVGGAGLARGYHRDPALTAERFVANPFEATPARLYRTGDLVRWRTDGTLAFLGRTDSQVKIRGYRVEPLEIETLLARHPAVTQAVVTTRADGAGAPQLTAYVTTADDDREERRRQVEHWHALYEEAYREGDAADPEFDIRGWNSSHDGRPLGAEVMREQVDHTSARIATLAPRRVLEIGCGTGLLLFRLAGGCDRYCATDFSPAALARVRRRIAERGWTHVELLERAADELDDLAGGGFDVVVLNSVVQYFPSAGYLETVLDGAVACLRPGGSLFVGDVRNHALLEAFHLSVELDRAPPGLSVVDLRGRIRRRVEMEQELLVDPAWFRQFAHVRSRDVRLAVWPRRGRHRNELTRFRYDAVLTLDTGADGPASPPWLDWDAAGLDVGELARRAASATAPLGVRGIPSARLEGLMGAERELASASDSLAVDGLRAMPADERAGVDPEDLWGLANGLDVQVGWHGSGETGRYDLLITPCGLPSGGLAPTTVPPRALTNDPLRRSGRLGAEIHDWLRERLPEQMVPTTVAVLDAIPVGPHGKVDLSALAPPDASEPLPTSGYAPPTTDTEERLAAIWARTLGLRTVGRHDNFFELGGDSILSIKLAARAAEAGLYFSTKQLFEHQTVADLARVVSFTPPVEAEQGPVVGQVQLTPIQEWFFGQELAEAHHFNQAALLAVPRGANLGLLVRALRAVVAHHDALHLRFAVEDGRWRQRGEPPDRELPVTSADLSAVPPAAVAGALERACNRLQASLALTGPLVRIGLFDLGPSQPRRLLIAIHHLAVDGVSWRILREDVWRAYGQLAEGLPVSLPPKTTSYRRWAERLVDRAADPETAAQAGLWLEQTAEELPLPRDLPGTNNTVAVTRSVPAALEPDETEGLLRRLLAQHRVEINEVLLFALARALGRWSGRGAASLAVEGHGREPLFNDVDLSRTVGWFTSIFPVLLRLPDDPDPVAGLSAVAEQVRRLPDRGIGYGLLRYLAPDPGLRERLGRSPWPEVAFNYHGQLDDGPVDPMRELAGQSRSPAGVRPHLLEVNGAVTGGRLQFDLHYSSAIHREETIRRLAEAFMAELRGLLATPAPDAPLADPASSVSARDLATLLKRLSDESDPLP
jgi:amino acid adenylation domain-containing protein/non-ribosomal peptide synthase protein (TIGR01720 family)